MRSISRLLAATAVASVVAFADTHAVFRGQPDTTSREVVHVAVDGSCTGVFVSRTVVLTAHHCVRTSLKGVVRSSIWPQVLRATAEESWWQGMLWPQRDLALLCVQSTPNVTATATLAFEPPGAKDRLTVIGYGLTAQKTAAKTLLQGDTTLSDVSATTFETSPPGSVACQGDSGGPVYKSGSRTLFGITRQFSSQQTCGSTATYSRVDLKEVRSWVADAIRNEQCAAWGRGPAEAP